MTEEQKELLKEKLSQLFNEKINLLTNKFGTDINTIETLKYSYFDNVLVPYREIEEKEKEKEESKEKGEKEKKEDKNEKSEEPKKDLKIKPLSLKEHLKLSKTPMKPKTARNLDFKGKTVAQPRKSKGFIPKNTEKSEHMSTLQKEKTKQKNLTTMEVTKKETAKRASKTPFSHRGRKIDEDKPSGVKTKNVKGTAVKTTTTKRLTGKGKAADKKGGKKEKKKVEKEEKEEEKKTEVKEEKKDIILKDKAIIKIPGELKNNNCLSIIYFVLKGNYLNNKEKYKIIVNNPTIYKSFGSNITFLLDNKKKDLQSKIRELETFLNQYGDLQTYLTKEFSPSKVAQNSLAFIKEEEITNIIKKGNIQREINDIFKLLFYIFDIQFDETLENENLLNYFISEIMDKNGVKDLKSFTLNYISTHKDLNISKEKVDKINDIINSDKKVLSSVDIAKIWRSISYSTLLIKECHEYLNLKTLDDVPYYELKYKNKMLQEYKNELAIIENNGIPAKVEKLKTGEKKNETDNVEGGTENQKIEEGSVTKEVNE